MNDMLTQLIGIWNEHDLDRLVTFYSDDYEGSDIGLAQTFHGRAGARHMAEHYYLAFPDITFTLHESIVQGNRAALSWMSTGTHRGKIMNIPPTGRTIKVSGVTTLSMHNGLVSHALILWDVAGLLRTIGLLPDL